MITAAVGVMLSVCAAEDWITGKISVWCPVICMVLSVVLRIRDNSVCTTDFWFGMTIGMAALVIGAVSNGQMGIGDGIVLTACGMCLGWRGLLLLLLCAALMFLGVGVGGILLKKWTGKKSMAFVPFLWGAFMLISVTGGI